MASAQLAKHGKGSAGSCSAAVVPSTYRYEYRAGVAAASRLWWAVQVVNTPAAALSWLHSWQKALVRRRAACQLIYTPLHVTARHYVATQAVALHPIWGPVGVLSDQAAHSKAERQQR
jgi:hypothetical protein